MYNCYTCNGTFDTLCKQGYKKFCSHKCYLKDWLRRNPSKPGLYDKNKWIHHVKSIGCSICGFNRAVDKCHVRWKKDGGKIRKDNIVILCPNHHRLYDRGKLTKDELALIKTVADLST